MSLFWFQGFQVALMSLFWQYGGAYVPILVLWRLCPYFGKNLTVKCERRRKQENIIMRRYEYRNRTTTVTSRSCMSHSKFVLYKYYTNSRYEYLYSCTHFLEISCTTKLVEIIFNCIRKRFFKRGFPLILWYISTLTK